MPLYTIAFALRGSNYNYAPLFQSLARAGAQRMWETTWLIDVNQDAPEVTKALLSFVKEGDSLLLASIGNDSPWSITGTDQATKDWLKQRTDLVFSQRSVAREVSEPDKSAVIAAAEQSRTSPPTASRVRKRRTVAIR